MSLLFDENFESTPDLRRFRNLVAFVIIPIISLIVCTISVYGSLFLIDIDDEYNFDNLLGVSDISTVLYGYILYISILILTAILATLLFTWLNVRRSNLTTAVVENLNNGKGLDKSYYAPEKNDRDHFYQADDQKLEIRVKEKMMFIWFMLGGTAVPTLFFAIHVYTDDISRFDAVLLLLSTAGLVIIFYNVCLMTMLLSFNRLDGTVTYFGLLLPWHRKIKFNKVQINAYANTFKLIIPYRLIPMRIIGEYKNAQAWWSYYVWYMDRNRPLPPGTLFDAYREKDYLRRKAEGFPVPLYESSIDTPEWEGATSQYNDPEVEKRNRTIYAGSSELAYQYVLRKSYLAQHTYMVRDIRQRRK